MENFNWDDNISFNIIDLQNMSNLSTESMVNENIKEATTSWISGKVVDVSAVYLDIYYHSSKYLSFQNTFEYRSNRVDYINDYITIDINTEKRVMLNDLVQIDIDFVKYIQKNNLIKPSINSERFGGAPEYLWEYLNEFTPDELLEELKKCSYTQERVIQDGYYPIDKSIGSLLDRNSFFFTK